MSRGCVLSLGFHVKSIAVSSLHMDYSALLAVTHYCGPFLLILKLDVDQMLGVNEGLCQISVRGRRYPIRVEWVPADLDSYRTS